MYYTRSYSFCPQLSEVECPLAVRGPRVQWYRPATLDQLLALRHAFPQSSDAGKRQCRIVAGNSEIGEYFLYMNIYM